MYREIKIQGETLALLSNGATPYLYKNAFKQDLILGMQRNQRIVQESKNKEEVEKASLILIDIGTKTAYITSRQATNANLSKLSEADFYKWLENYEATTFLEEEIQTQIYSVIIDDMEESSEPKNT